MAVFSHAVVSLVLIRSVLGKYECSGKDLFDLPSPDPKTQLPTKCADSTFGSCTDTLCCEQQRTCAYYQTGDPTDDTSQLAIYGVKCNDKNEYLDIAKATHKVPSPGDVSAITKTCCSPTKKCSDHPGTICSTAHKLIPTANLVDAPDTMDAATLQTTCCEDNSTETCSVKGDGANSVGKGFCADKGIGPAKGKAFYDLRKADVRYVPTEGAQFQINCCSDFTQATCFQFHDAHSEACPVGKIVNLNNSAVPDGSNLAVTLSIEKWVKECCVARAKCGSFACPATHDKMSADTLCDSHSVGECTAEVCCAPKNTCADALDEWTWDKCPDKTFFDVKKSNIVWERVFQTVGTTADVAKAQNLAKQQASCCTPLTEMTCFDWTSTKAISAAVNTTTDAEATAKQFYDAATPGTTDRAALKTKWDETVKAKAKAAAAALAAQPVIAAETSPMETFNSIGSAFFCPTGKYVSELSAAPPNDSTGKKLTNEMYQLKCCTGSIEQVSCAEAKSPFLSSSAVPVPEPVPTVSPVPVPEPVPTGSPVPVPAPEPVPTNETENKFCVNIETGTEKSNDGRLDVRIYSDGAYHNELLGKRFGLAEIVMTPCFLNPVDYVEVRNPTGDSWTGSIQYSVDKRATWNIMNCSVCTGSFGSITVVNKNKITSDVVTARRLSPTAGSSCDTGGWCKTVPLDTGATFCANWTEACPLKWQDKVGNKAKLPCSDAECTVSDCCYQPINCASWSCPANQPKRPGAEGVLCFGSQCTDSQCCQPVTITPISCASWSSPCPVNQVAKALTSMCVGAQCVASDCCQVGSTEPVAMGHVRRRRRNGDMESCRRRNGRKDNPEGYSCGLHSFVRSLPTTFVSRRRRNGNPSCRRRNGHHDNSAGFTCAGHSIVLVDGMRKFASYDGMLGTAVGHSAAFNCLFVVGITSAIGIVAVLRRRAASHDVGHEQLPNSETDADSEKA